MSSGILPGTTRPDETVIYTAHWDHLGIGLPDANGDRIYNGAIDNGTGIAHRHRAGARLRRGPRTERSVVFLLVAAEEKGLLGCEYYAANPLYPLGKTAGVINTDVMGVLGPGAQFQHLAATGKFGLLDLLIAEGAKRGRSFMPDPRPRPAASTARTISPSPRSAFRRSASRSGNDLVNGGVARGEAWPTIIPPSATTSPTTNIRRAGTSPAWRRTPSCSTRVGLRLANSNDWPNWSEDSEFRAMRDQSAAERGRTGARRPERG